MANINVTAVPSNTNVTVQDANNIQLSVQPATTVRVEVTPTATQTIQLNRGVAGPQGPQGPAGPQGPSGTAEIGGYPVSITGAQNYDALMFLNNAWINIPQTEISDGGNF